MMRRRMQIRVAWLLCAGQPSTASARRSVKRHWASRVPFRAAHTGLARHSTSKQLTKHLHFHFKEGNMSPMSSLQSQRSTCMCNLCYCLARLLLHRTCASFVTAAPHRHIPCHRRAHGFVFAALFSVECVLYLLPLAAAKCCCHCVCGSCFLFAVCLCAPQRW